MSVFDTLDLRERAQQLRNPTGEIGLAVAEMFAKINQEGNRRTVAELELAPDDRVLEIGCGLGAMAETVVHQAEGVRYTGLDSSSTMIDSARERNAGLVRSGTATFHLAGAEHMPFEDASFSKVFSVGVVHFWQNPTSTLAEVVRVMRPGALMLMGCLGPERAPPFAQAENGFYLHDAEQWRSFCRTAGLVEVTIDTFSLGSENGPQLYRLAARV